jgi:hypothetical protein
MVQKNSIIWPKWRIKLLKRLDLTLILFEFVLSIIFISFSYIVENIYFKGIGIGLLIAWVTSAIAYIFKKKAPKSAY